MRTCLALISASVLAACGKSASSTGTTSSQQAICASDPRAEVYSVGLEEKAKDGNVAVTFVDALPAPPERGENTWTIHVTDSAGKPVIGADIAFKGWMPDHGHGNTTVPTITEVGGGDYKVDPVVFYMPGIWQATFTVTPAQGSKDDVVFTFCIDG